MLDVVVLRVQHICSGRVRWRLVAPDPWIDSAARLLNCKRFGWFDMLLFLCFISIFSPVSFARRWSGSSCFFSSRCLWCFRLSRSTSSRCVIVRDSDLFFLVGLSSFRRKSFGESESLASYLLLQLSFSIFRDFLSVSPVSFGCLSVCWVWLPPV